MRDCVVGFREVDIDSEERLLVRFVFMDVAEDGLQRESCAGVGPESVSSC